VNNLAANQDQNITQQLRDGVRMLQMQAHNNSGTIYLCHTACGLYNGGTLLDYLKTVKTWMDTNPNEVVTLLIVNSDNLPAAQFASVFVAAGVDSMSYSPKSASLPASDWPTLGSLVDAGTRLITFLSTTASFEAAPYLIDEFSNIWETPYNTLDKTAFQCQKDRGTGDVSTSMFMINHFLDTEVLGNPVPDVANANLTNAASGPGSLGEEVSVCAGLYNRYPNFLLVDYYDYGGGSVFQVAATANGVAYTGNASTPQSTTTSSKSPASTSPTSSGNDNSGSSANYNFGIATLFCIVSVTLGAFSVFI
jgi:hypothetical protein